MDGLTPDIAAVSRAIAQAQATPCNPRILQAIIDHLPSGVTLFDDSLQMVVCNQLFRTLLDFPDSLFAGGLPSFQHLALFNARRGEYGPGEPEELAAAVVARARQRTAHVLERARPNGTFLEIRGTPLPEGGFVSIYTDITRRKKAEDELRHLATTDPLTGAGNRRHFMALASAEVARSQREELPLSALMLDLDFFKRVNDQYGHAGGDEALRRFVARCIADLRGSDILGRLGGEEFAAILPETDSAGAMDVAHRLRRHLAAEDITCDRGTFRFTVSIGVAALKPGDSLEELLRRADEALYWVKAHGRNGVHAL
jgi:diguanylate cyclase (GGDEF)-like protein